MDIVKRGGRCLNLIMFIFLLFFIHSSFTNAYVFPNTVTSANPIIVANFYEDPVDIIDYSLISLTTEIDHTQKIIHTPSQNRMVHNFSIENGYITSGDYELWIKARDDDQNEIEDTLQFTVNLGTMMIGTYSPRHFFSPLFDDYGIHYAYGTTLPFNLTVWTPRDAVCKIGRQTGNNLPSQFSSMTAILQKSTTLYDIDSDDIDETIFLHKVIVSNQEVDGVINTSRLQLFYSGESSYNPQQDHFIVICQEGEDDGISYHPQELMVGYDPTPPDFTSIANPNIITDNYDRNTEINIDSNHDMIICSHQENSIPYPPGGCSQDEFERYYSAPLELSDFYHNYSRPFNFSEYTCSFTPEQNYDYLYNITCYNPAGLSTTNPLSFSVLIDTNLDIELISPLQYVRDSSFQLHVRTNIFSNTCQFRIDDTSYNEYADMTESGGNNRDFVSQISGLKDGTYEVLVKCEGAVDFAIETFEIIKDTTPPNPPTINDVGINCDPDGIELVLETDEDNLRFNYSIFWMNGSNPVPVLTNAISSEDETILFFEPDNMTSGVRYKWEVRALDRAGLFSSLVSHTQTIYEPDSPQCDLNPPSMNVIQEAVAEGFKVTFECEDDETGCTDSFYYSQKTLDQNCTFPPQTAKTYASQESEPIIVNENTRICYQARDQANPYNVFNGTEDVTRDITIRLVNPSLGISPSKVFNLDITTSRSVSCKAGYVFQGHPTDLTIWYNNPQMQSFTSIGGITHRISNYNPDQFDSDEDELSLPWVILCNENGLIHKKEFTLGYDLTNPELIVTANPNPINDEGNMQTTLNVESDDPVFCTYANYLTDGLGIPFTDYDPNNIEDYIQSFSKNLIYYEPQLEDEQTIMCRNLAGRNVEDTSLTITVNIIDQIGITINTEEYVPTHSFTLSATTLQGASCEYKTSAEASFVPFTTTGSYEHSSQLNLQDNTYTIFVRCQHNTNLDTGLVTKTITVDSLIPTITLITPQISCGLTSADLLILSNGTGSPMNYFNTTLKDSTGEILLQLIHTNNNINPDVTLEEDETYTWSVIGYDMAGHASSVKTASFKGSIDDPLECDNVPPTATVTQRPIWGETEVTITCNDDKSGCSDNFGYQFVGETCINNSYLPGLYSNLPLKTSQPKMFCYEVFDKSLNKVYGTKDINVRLDCFNHRQDPLENGVDCGGVCTATCGTCENSIQDAFELGIDCGGVCHVIDSCDEAPLNNSSSQGSSNPNEITCETNDDCSYGRECVSGFCELSQATDKPKRPTPKEDDFPWVGVILIIVGFVFALGGAGYIYYSKNYLNKPQEQEVVQQLTPEQQEAIRQRQIEEQRRIQELMAKRKQMQDEKFAENRNLKTKERASLLGSFESGSKDAQSTDVVKDEKTIKTNNDESSKSELTKKEKKLDDGFEGDYIEVDKLGKPIKNEPKQVKKDSTEKTSDSTTNIKSNSSQQPKEKVVAKPQEITRSKEDQKALDALANISKSKDLTKAQAFDALSKISGDKKTVNTIKTKKVIGSDEFIKIFEKDAPKEDLRSDLFKSILQKLVAVKQIDETSINKILDEFYNRKLLTKQNIKTILSDLNFGDDEK